MAVRQYIGARYVTKIYENSLDPSSAEWEASINYEPLTMVTYNNGSYLSKKDVPASVGNPASNPTYWVQTGFYNGQIASLQSQIDTINGLLLPLVGRKIAIVTDSYGSVESDWMSHIADALNLTLDAYPVSGRGFVEAGGVSFSDSLDHFNVTDNEYDYLLTLGGQNDVGNTYSDIYNAVTSYITKAKTLFPNTKIFIVGPQAAFSSVYGSTSENLAICEDAIKNACFDNGGVAYANPSNWLADSYHGYHNAYSNDMAHPSHLGYLQYEVNLISLLTGNAVKELPNNFTFTPTSIVTSPIVYVSTDKNHIHIDAEMDVATAMAAQTSFKYNLLKYDDTLWRYLLMYSKMNISVYVRDAHQFTFVGLLECDNDADKKMFTLAPTGSISVGAHLCFKGDIYLSQRAATIGS